MKGKPPIRMARVPGKGEGGWPINPNVSASEGQTGTEMMAKGTYGSSNLAPPDLDSILREMR